MCFVCGKDNAAGLHLRFGPDPRGGQSARWQPRAPHQGYPGFSHGGLIGAVLDESMSKSVAALGIEALTAELRLRYRVPVEVGVEYCVRGWVVEQHTRVIECEAVIEDGAGRECAHAWGSFMPMRRRPR